jgi:hypothetical protein
MAHVVDERLVIDAAALEHVGDQELGARRRRRAGAHVQLVALDDRPRLAGVVAAAAHVYGRGIGQAIVVAEDEMHMTVIVLLVLALARLGHDLQILRELDHGRRAGDDDLVPMPVDRQAGADDQTLLVLAELHVQAADDTEPRDQPVRKPAHHVVVVRLEAEVIGVEELAVEVVIAPRREEVADLR